MSVDRHVLTAAEVKALRACRALMVHGNVGLDGQTNDAIIRIIVRTGEAIQREQDTETMFTTYARCDYYGVQGQREKFAGGKLTSHMFHYPEQITTLGTIFSLLKAGDEVGITWGIGGYTSKGMESCNVTGDTLQLNVRRLVPKTGKTTDMVFTLNTCISTLPSTRLILER